MKVVSDTSPLSYLILVGRVQLLPDLLGAITIPGEVHAELLDQRAPTAIRQWAAHLPAWLEVRTTPALDADLSLETPLTRLDIGERAAIRLAESLRADLILLDERAGRRVAAERGLK